MGTGGGTPTGATTTDPGTGMGTDRDRPRRHRHDRPRDGHRHDIDPGTATGTGTTDPAGTTTTDPAGTTTDPAADHGETPPTIPGTDLPDLTHDPNMETPPGVTVGPDPNAADPASMGTPDSTMPDETINTADAVGMIADPAPIIDHAAPTGLVDEFDTVAASPAASSGDLIDTLYPDRAIVADSVSTPETVMANTDLSQAATPVSFDDDLLGTNAMAQATEMAPPMPDMAAPPPPEVTMTVADLTPSFRRRAGDTGIVPARPRRAPRGAADRRLRGHRRPPTPRRTTTTRTESGEAQVKRNEPMISRNAGAKRSMTSAGLVPTIWKKSTVLPSPSAGAKNNAWS